MRKESVDSHDGMGPAKAGIAVRYSRARTGTFNNMPIIGRP